MAHARSDWRELLVEVPRETFIPDTIWVDRDIGCPQSGFVSLSRQDDPQRWRRLATGNEPVVTQVDGGKTPPGSTGWSPSSSCSKPSIVADMLEALDIHRGHSVLEIGTGTGWNAALLYRRVGKSGQVVSIEVDPTIADAARNALARSGYTPLVICADGVDGYPDNAPYDRILATASVRDMVPRSWLEQTRPGGRVVTPWGTDYCNGVMLTLHRAADGTATGRFSGDLAFMRLRSQQRQFYEPDQIEIENAETITTEVHGWDFFRMVNSDQAAFSIGLLVPCCALTVQLKRFGNDHHVLELDDITTRSWAQLDAHLTSPHKLTVRQLGPRRLWEEAEAAYDWWYARGRPGLARFGMTITASTHTVWLDDPGTVVRDLADTSITEPESSTGVMRATPCPALSELVATTGPVDNDDTDAPKPNNTGIKQCPGVGITD